LFQPNWPNLLQDYKLVKDAEEFRQLREKSLKDAALIDFTVLSRAHNVDLPALIYWDSRKRFVTEVDYEESIDGIKLEDATSKYLPSFAFSPKVFFKLRGVGYEMGLAVSTDWWKWICATGEIGELVKTKADTNDLIGETRLLRKRTLPSAADGKAAQRSRPNSAKRRGELDPELARTLTESEVAWTAISRRSKPLA
jgi:hypothetical protein